eukprot:4827917-Prymnesium_polylepis.1
MDAMDRAIANAKGHRVKPRDPTHHSANWDDILQYNHKNGNEGDNMDIAWETTVDVFLLSLCDVFIGKHTSNVFRTAYELHASRCHCAAPFVSLDAPWCFDWG